MADDIEIRVRVRGTDMSGFRDVDGRLRDMRGRFATEGDAAGNALARGIGGKIPQINNMLGMLASAGSFGNLAGLPVILANIASAALLVPGAVSMAAAAIGTLQLATSGVGEAFAAMGKSVGGGGGGGGGGAIASSARSIRDALDAVGDAKRRQAQVVEDTNRDIAKAERDVARASVESARDVARAKHDQARVEEDVADSIANALEQQQKATEDLDDARQQAARTLDDLRDKVAHYANDEEGARLRVLAAYAAQRKVNADVTSTNLEKAQSAQNVKDAEERLADVQKSRTEDTAKLAAEEAKGVEGSDQVVAAKERVADADKNVAKAREDGAERIAEAAQRVSEAEEAGAERVAAAKEALADTERSAARSRADAAESVADAEMRLKDAQEDAAKSSGAAAGGANAYADALKKLSPNARAFVEEIRRLKPAWDEMQKAVQNSFFEGFAEKTRQLSDKYLPELKSGLSGIASAMNGIALYAADALLKPDSLMAINTILGNTKAFFTNAKTALGDFIEGFLGLAKIGSDYLPAIGKWLSDIARDFKEWVQANPKEIKKFIEDGLQTLKDLWGVLTEVVRLFHNLFADSTDGRTFLQLLRDVIGFLADHAGAVKVLLYAIATAWVVSKVAGFAGAVRGVIGLVRTLASRIRGLPPLPGGALRALGTAAIVAAPVAVGYGVSKAVSGKFDADPTAQSNGGGESSQQGAAGFAHLLESLGSLGSGDSGPIVKWWDDQMTILNQDIADIGNSPLGQFFTLLGEQWQVGWEGVTEFLNGIPQWWNDLWATVSAGFAGWWDLNVAIPAGNVWQWLQDTWNSIPGWWSGLWAAIGAAVSNWWNINVAIPAGNVWRWLQDVWNGIPGWWNGLWATIARIVSGWWQRNISDPLNQALAFARGLWEGFKSYLNFMAGQIGAGLSRMWGGLVNGARGAANGAIAIINGMITGLNRAIAGLNMINPFGRIGYVSYVPYLATGGITGSGMAIVGERGPELVKLGAGAQVKSAGDTRRVLGQQGGGGGGAMAIELRVAPGADSALASLLTRMVRTGELQLTPSS